jgi:hypothetical protein
MDAVREHRQLEVDTLLKEYAEVQQHYRFATQQKSIVINLLITIASAFLGAYFLGHVSIGPIALIGPVILSIFLFVYGQKEAEYWMALLCLERIEDRVNKLLGSQTMTYISIYKRFLFPKPHHKRSFVVIMQYLRTVPGAIAAIFVFKIIYQKYGLLITILELSVLLSALAFVAWATVRVQRKFLQDEVFNPVGE